MKYIQRYIASLGLLIITSSGAYSQYSNPILTSPVDAQGAALGHVSTLSGEMPLYTIPTLALDQANVNPIKLSYTLGLTPSKEHNHRQYLHSLASSHRLGKRHAVLLGARYWRGLPTPYTDVMGSKLGTIHPQDWTLDASYAYAMSSALKFSAGVSYLNAYSSQTSHSAMVHLTASYQGQLSFLREGQYLLVGSIRNVGSKMSYGRKRKSYNSLPTYIEGAGRIGLTPLQGHNLQIGIALRYYTSISGAQALVYQAGTEYRIQRLLALRLGGLYQQNNSQITMGLGKEFGPLDISLAYNLQTYSQFNILNIGLSLSL
ncbi:MAG: PorV/PorQ family protein [Porphyromonadaceae bacterium]|nr:PorV/PorQ family protein [Porphyromonadaceae bacterium]